MAFSEVREYMAGDDIRSIDWNVTARFNHPYVKVFEEERELTVVLLGLVPIGFLSVRYLLANTRTNHLVLGHLWMGLPMS